MVDEQFLAELKERLVVHFVDQRWRAPLSERALPIARPRAGKIMCGTKADVTRAVAGLRQGAIDTQAMRAAATAVLPVVGAVRALEAVGEDLRDMDPPTPSGAAPVMLLSAASTPPDRVITALLANAPRGVLWKPAPGTAASAHVIMRALGPVAGGRLAMVQGDHQTGAIMAATGPVIWMSGAPMPVEISA